MIRLETLDDPDEIVNPKGTLQEWCQRNLPGNPVPKYDVVGNSGPAHHPTFNVEVMVMLVGHIGIGKGLSKRKAEERAAKDLLKWIRSEY